MMDFSLDRFDIKEYNKVYKMPCGRYIKEEEKFFYNTEDEVILPMNIKKYCVDCTWFDGVKILCYGLKLDNKDTILYAAVAQW